MIFYFLPSLCEDPQCTDQLPAFHEFKLINEIYLLQGYVEYWIDSKVHSQVVPRVPLVIYPGLFKREVSLIKHPKLNNKKQIRLLSIANCNGHQITLLFHYWDFQKVLYETERYMGIAYIGETPKLSWIVICLYQRSLLPQKWKWNLKGVKAWKIPHC